MPAKPHTAARRKKLGAFYTPPEMAEKLVDWCIRSASDTVLDPSFGGLIFLKLAQERLLALGSDRRDVSRQVVGIDVDDAALSLAEDAGLAACRLIHADFFDVEPTSDLRVTANVGNPPYIRYQSWNGQSRSGHAIAAGMGVKLTRLASAWAPFILHGTRFLEKGGRMAQVLPAELIHSQYAHPVLNHLKASFEQVTVVVFVERVFPGALEEVVLLFAERYGRGPAPGVGVVSCRSLDDLDLTSIDGHGRGHLDPATPLLGLLPRSTQAIYKRLAGREEVRTLGDLASVDIGAVTGANDFFIRCRSEVSERGFDRSLFLPTVSKATHLRGARLSRADVSALEISGNATALLLTKGASNDALDTVSELIEEGRRAGLHKRYKCRIRKPWHAVPLPTHGMPDAFLTYMSNRFPKLVQNDAEALSTNTVHGVTMRHGRSVAALCAGFYNSLTLLSAELVGRSYGGGILKLEPTEAERLVLPPLNGRLAKKLDEIDGLLRQGDLDAVLDLVDPLVLGPLGTSARQIAALRRARENLSSRRRARSGKGPKNTSTAHRRAAAAR